MSRHDSCPFIPLFQVTWVLWGSPKGWGEGGTPHPSSPPMNAGYHGGLDHHPRSHDAGFPILNNCATRWSSHSTMPSEEEQQQPGPSGISREELSPLSGLNVTNDDEEAIGEEEEKEHPSCNQTKDDFDRQRTFQTQLLEQSDHTPQRSSRKRHQLKPGHHTLSLLKSKKRSIVQIRNTDVLCCARALVTAKAKVDRHPKWRSFRDGTGKIQKEHALLLHYEANVPFGPCGYEELAQFSQAPSLFDYQILLVDADRAIHITSFGSPAPDKQLVLLHDKGHYDVITSLPGWDFNTLKKAIYKEVLNNVLNMPDRFFENKEVLVLVIQALRRRDLHGIAQAVVVSPQFYDLCQTSGLFTVEPSLRTWYHRDID